MSIEKFKKEDEDKNKKQEDFCMQCLAAPALAGAVAAAGTTKTTNKNHTYILYGIIFLAVVYGLYTLRRSSKR